MYSTRRNTRNSQRSGISDTLRHVGRAPSDDEREGSREASEMRQPSPQRSNVSALTPIPGSERSELGINQPGYVQHPDQGNPDHNDPNPDDPNPDNPDDSDPEDRSGDSDNEPPPVGFENQLARSLALLARKIDKIPNGSRSTIKPRSPDTFDGTDPAKLETFTFQISMYIAARSKDFPDDESQVTFAMSYLKGTPLEWFQTEVNHAIQGNGRFPRWFQSYPLFVAELQRLFGPRDPVTEATTALEGLKYKDSTKATRYTVEFNRHARRTGWNEQALTRQYYKGLPDRLKDELARVGKPVTLRLLQDTVAVLDQRHWERQSEISRDKRSTSTSTTSHNKASASDNRPDKQQSSSQASGSKPPAQQDKHKDVKKPYTNTNKPSSSSKPTNSISDLLGSDGKLKPEERQRRMDHNLCLRCGNKGHVARDCPVPSKDKPKGRAAATTSAAASSAAGNPGTGKA